MADFVISANRTADGGVVYLTADRRWTERLADASSHGTRAGGDAGLTWARTQEAVVCDPHLIKVQATADGPVPLDTKQRIRAAGPQAMLSELGFLGAVPDGPFIHRAELPETRPEPPTLGELQAGTGV